MKYLLPTGIGDSCWALFKIQSVHRSLDPTGPIDVYLVGHDTVIDRRAIDFVRRFRFVNSVQMKECQIVGTPWHTPEGYYSYVEDGMYELADANGTPHRYCALIPNAALERGIRLENWLPHHDINWDIFTDFVLTDAERGYGEKLRSRVGDYAVFYPGPLGGNTLNGHNRGMIWRPSHWLALGRRLHAELGLHIVTVGAPYDATYYDLFLDPLLDGDHSYWTNLIGQTSIGELYGVTSAAKLMVSYQAGVGIIATYLGTPTAIFWRARGDSISPDEYLSFEESMASAWVPPAMIAAGTHMPLIYGRHDANFIADAVASRGWAR